MSSPTISDWSEPPCSLCVHCEWKRLIVKSPQVPLCRNELTKHFTPPIIYLERDATACGLFELRPETFEILAELESATKPDFPRTILDRLRNWHDTALTLIALAGVILVGLAIVIRGLLDLIRHA